MMLRLRPFVQRYDWGGRGRGSYVRRLLGSRAGPGPWAEAWYGTHPHGPSSVEGGARLAGVAGPLPFLVKIIEAHRPLSLQVHPDARQARAGFARESRRGIPLHAPERCFRDRNAKPEILIPLTPFDLFAGVMSSAAIRADPLCRRLLSAGAWGRAAAPGALFRRVFSLSPGEVRARGRDLFRPGNGPSPRAGWLRRLWKTHGERRADPACLALVFLQFHRRAPGRAIFLAPGVPHAYLRGAGVEVMTASDNVVRLGLTSKPVRWEEAVSLMGVGLAPRSLPLGGLRRLPGVTWQLRFIRSTGARSFRPALRRPALFLVLRGRFSSPGLASPLWPGEALFLSPGTKDPLFTGRGEGLVVG